MPLAGLFGEGGQRVKEVKRRPQYLLLLDQIEEFRVMLLKGSEASESCHGCFAIRCLKEN